MGHTPVRVKGGFVYEGSNCSNVDGARGAASGSRDPGSAAELFAALSLSGTRVLLEPERRVGENQCKTRSRDLMLVGDRANLRQLCRKRG